MAASRASRHRQNVRTGAMLVACASLVAAGCNTGSGQGLDDNGRPIGENDPGVPLSPELGSIQANVFTPVCTVCHAGAAAPVGLRLDAANAFAALVGIDSVQVPGVQRVTPFDPDASYLVQKLEGTAAVGERMPLGGPFLPQSTIDVIRQWIAEGALPPAGSPPATPPVVIASEPADGATLAALPAQIRVTFDRDMDAALVSSATIVVERSGGDGTFGDGNEIGIDSDSVALLGQNARVAVFSVAAGDPVDDSYRIIAVGTGAQPLADNNGNVLDGDGDGNPGGDFVAGFTVALLEPTLAAIQRDVFTPSCATAGCHTGPAGPGLPAGQDLSGETASFLSLVDVNSVEFPSLKRVAPGDADASYLVQKLEGTAAVGAQMPLDAVPLDPRVIASIRAWIDAGASFGDDPPPPPPDDEPPVVALVPPPVALSGSVALTAIAGDNVAVAQVAFSIDGVVVGVDTSEPYGIVWDSTTVADGEHSLVATATDTSGLSTSSEAVTVSVQNDGAPADTTPPIVALAVPASPLTGLVTLTASASDDVGVSVVRFLVDGNLLASDPAAPYSADFDTAAVVDGAHTIVAEAEDAAGNVGVSASVTVTVDNASGADTVPPAIGSVDPLDAATLDAWPGSMVLVANEALEASSVTLAAVTLTRSGGDGTFDDGNDVAVDSLSLALSPDGFTVTLDLSGAEPAEDSYRLIVSGDGAAAWTDAAGNALDGDGDGTAGGSLVSGFVVDGLVASLASIQDRIFTTRCAFCHSGNGGGLPGVMNLSNVVASHANLVNVPSLQEETILRVAPGNADASYLVHKLEGTQDSGDQMPLGGPFLDSATIAVVREWIDRGAAP